MGKVFVAFFQILVMEGFYSTPFSKAILTAVFAGIAATVLSMTYNIVFRNSTHFTPSDFINVSSLIFFINLLFLVIGIIYYAFLQLKRGELLFTALFALLTVLFVVLAGAAHRSNIPVLNAEFHHLLVPIVLIMGLTASLGIPFLYHNKKFEEHVV